MRELHQIGESCWSNGDGACGWVRILGRLLDDSLIIGGDNKHCFAGRRRARRRWRGGTRLPQPAVIQNQHQTETIEPLCSTLEEANCAITVLDFANLAIVLLHVHYVLWSFYISDTCVAIVLAGQNPLSVKSFTGHKHILEDRLRFDDSQMELLSSVVQRTSSPLHCTGNILQYKIQSDI